MILSLIEDKISTCYVDDSVQFTDFLTLEEAASAQLLLESVGIDFKFWGGYEYAERRMVALSVDKISCEYPITILCGSWDKFGEISHRDILGAIMSCGIERRCVGDILLDLQCRKFYLFIVSRMGDYIVQNVSSIGRCSVCWSVVTDIDQLPKISVKEISVAVSSLRIDNIIAAVYHLSRKKAQDLVTNKKVYINHLIVSKITQNLSPQSTVVVRGFGKFKLVEQTGLSKKGKIYIKVKQYI